MRETILPNTSGERPTRHGFILCASTRAAGTREYQFVGAPFEGVKVRQNIRVKEFSHQRDMRQQRPRLSKKIDRQQLFLEGGGERQ